MKSLEQEKKILLREKAELDKEEFLSLDGILGNKKPGEKNAEGGGGSLLDFLPISDPLVNTVINTVQGLFTKKTEETKTGDSKRSQKRSHKSPLNAIAGEFIGSYLKWKAIELSYKGIKHILKSRRDKKEKRN